jgi:FtsH-binding integral membrane protein
MAMTHMAVITLNTFNFILILGLIMLTAAILRLFRDLPKLSRPWILMLVSLLFFSVHYATVVTTEMDFGDAAMNELVFQTFGTAFLVFLGLSLYSFWKTWGTAK